MLAGKSALITGAAGGIGKEAALLFAKHGARVWLGDIDTERTRRIADENPELDLCSVELDVTSADSVTQALETITGDGGRLDILYNNAGGTQPGETVLTEADDAVFWNTIGVDLFGTWLCCKHAAAHMQASGGGTIVNTSSIAALTGFAKNPAYSAAKGGVSALTRSLAVAFAEHGIRVNAVAPGITLSPRVEASVKSGRLSPAMQDRHLLGLLDCGKIANAALFLASDLSGGMTGQIVNVDSGAGIA